MLTPAQLLRIDLSLLVLFKTVLEEGNVARAAQMMALTQLAESDLVATLPRHLVERHAARFKW